MSLSERVLAGDQRAIARLATYIENDEPVGREALEKLYSATGRAFTFGVTGPPGAGKSSFINGLIHGFRARGLTVGVIAIDPSSPVSGGATLGDRIRMLDRHDDPGVFIRSLAARGGAGGLAPATSGITHLLDAAGFDRIMIETVGVGQDDVEITRLVDCTLLLQVPGLGDSVQAMKAGILELADIYVVHKADLPGAGALAKELRSTLLLGQDIERAQDVMLASSTTGEGTGEVVEAIERLRATMERTGELARRRETRAGHEIMRYVEREIRHRLQETTGEATTPLISEVAARRLTPARAAERLLAADGQVAVRPA